MAFKPNVTSVAVFESYGAPQGLRAYNPNDPFASFYKAIVARNTPSGVDASSFGVQCEAMLRARGLIYWKSNPGDCGSAGTQLSQNDLMALHLTSSAASVGLGALGTAGIISGAATLGIGAGVTVAVAAIQQLFAHHAEAVRNEQATICQVAGIVNQVIKYLDANVINGNFDPGDAANTFKNYVLQVNGQLDSIKKTCNAACYYEGFLNAQADFALIYYSNVAPSGSARALSPSNPSIGNLVSRSPLSSPSFIDPYEGGASASANSGYGGGNLTALQPGSFVQPPSVNAALSTQAGNFWLIGGGLLALTLLVIFGISKS